MSALFVTAKYWKLPKCPNIQVAIKKGCPRKISWNGYKVISKLYFEVRKLKCRLQIVCHLLCEKEGENGKISIYLLIYTITQEEPDKKKLVTFKNNNNDKRNWLLSKDGKERIEIKKGLTILSVFFSTVLTFRSMLKFYMLNIFLNQ